MCEENNQGFKDINNNISNRILIKGIEILFPFEPYGIQKNYMEKVIELLNKKSTIVDYNGFAALESPTGTGKTLCLLCSILAWFNKKKQENKFTGKIIYVTRTHSQISQIISELKKTEYRPKIAILSSRQFSCALDNLKKNKDINQLNIICRKIRKNCIYKNDFDDNFNFGFNENHLVDIEDLCKEGKLNHFCPYYHQINKAQNSAEIIFMTYNNLFNENIRNNLKININDNIIIIDEAHNIGKICENEKSLEISESDFQKILDELNIILNHLNELLKLKYLESISSELIEKEINIIEKIKNKFSKFKEEHMNYKNGISISYKELIELISFSLETNKDNIDISDGKLFNNIQSSNTILNLQKNINILLDLKNCFEIYKLKQSYIEIIIKLFTISGQLLYNPEINDSFYFYLCKEKDPANLANNYEKKLKIFCYNPGLLFKEIIDDNPYALIMTSGSLKPFDVLEKELDIRFDILLENKHIIKNGQFKFTIINKVIHNGNSYKLRFDLYNRNNEKMIESLGEIIFNLTKTNNKGGILLFFPSYKYLEKCYNIWQKCKINEKIKKYKSIILDSFNQKLLCNDIIKSENKNFILFSVHRGSSSEGIDFSDDNARMVICIGIPYANYGDDKIKKKKEFLNNKEKFLGNKWYEADAMVNVNQSLGRVIRNKDDYGVMICIDERFNNYSIKSMFSDWIYKNKEIRDLIDNDSYFDEINKFFEYCQNKYSNQNALNNSISLNYNNDFMNLNKENNDSEKSLLRKREREKIEKEDSDEEKSFNLFNNNEEIKKGSEEEEDSEESSSNDENIDKELYESMFKDKNFNFEQYQKLQNNQNVFPKKNIEKCPVCLTKISQSTFLCFSIAECNHIICNICWNKILAKNKECPLCKKNINFSELRKIIKDY